MSSSININMNQTLFTEIQGKSVINNNQNPQLKVAGFEKEHIEPSDAVNLSKEGRLKLANSLRTSQTASAVGQRGLWRTERGVRLDPHVGEVFDDVIEVLRIDEPETYAKWEELFDKEWELKYKGASFSSDGAIEEDIMEYEKISLESSRVLREWYERRCMRDGHLRNPAEGKYAILDSLEEIHSADGQETSFNCYSSEKAEGRNSLWRFQSKFNVLISGNMLTNLVKLGDLDALSDKDRKDVSDLLEKISDSVGNMKEAEKQYEGNLEYLRFGVKLWDNGDVTYHANYKGCGNRDGIMANSTKELLEMLMKTE